MKKIIFYILSLTTLFTQGQDPSFSQFDLNMMYSNPAFSGYEGATKSLLHSRNQWNKLNEKFNNSIFEISTNIKLNPNNRKGATSYSPGLGVISEDLRFTSSVGNQVFIHRIEASFYPFTFHMRIDFKIGKLKINNLWLSGGGGINARKYNLDDSYLFFSDQWGDLGAFMPISLAPVGTFSDVTTVDGSVGFILTKHGKYQSTQGNRLMAGWSLSHIRRPNEDFSHTGLESSRIPLKNIVHAEWFYGFPAFKRPFIPYFKTIFKHERYIDDVSKAILPWKESLISKTEFGGTAFINNTPIELGVLYRIDHNFEKDYHLQTFIPIIRYRINRKNLLVISYSYDMNIAGNTDRLTIGNTGTTHEMGIAIYLNGGRGRKGECPAFMQNSALYKDIYNNGLLNKSKTKKNFK